MTIFKYTVEDDIGEVDIIIEVTSYTHVPSWQGSVESCPSDTDFYGYTEIEWEVQELLDTYTGKPIELERAMFVDLPTEDIDPWLKEQLANSLDFGYDGGYDVITHFMD